MAEVARNLIHRPITTDRPVTGTSAAWTRPDDTPAPVGGTDNKGNPLRGVHTTGVAVFNNPTPNITRIACTPLDGVEPGDPLHVWLTTRWSAAGGVTVDLVADRSAAPQTVEAAGPSAMTWPTAAHTDVSVQGQLTVPEHEGELWLRVYGYIRRNTDYGAVWAVRAAQVPEDDGYGVFDGNTPAAGTMEYSWTGEPELSASKAVDTSIPDPDDPGTEPDDPGTDDPAALPLARRVAAYLGRADETETVALAELHVETVTAYVYGYTRGRGFTDGRPAPDLAHVVVAAAAVLTSNPEQVSYYSTGDYSERPAVLAGWTLPQLAILHRYRRRFA